jgi:hypothetical protein
MVSIPNGIGLSHEGRSATPVSSPFFPVLLPNKPQPESTTDAATHSKASFFIRKVSELQQQEADEANLTRKASEASYFLLMNAPFCCEVTNKGGITQCFF